MLLQMFGSSPTNETPLRNQSLELATRAFWRHLRKSDCPRKIKKVYKRLYIALQPTHFVEHAEKCFVLRCLGMSRMRICPWLSTALALPKACSCLFLHFSQVSPLACGSSSTHLRVHTLQKSHKMILIHFFSPLCQSTKKQKQPTPSNSSGGGGVLVCQICVCLHKAKEKIEQINLQSRF